MNDLARALRRLDDDEHIKKAAETLKRLIRLKKAGRLSSFGERHVRKTAIKTMRKSKK